MKRVIVAFGLLSAALLLLAACSSRQQGPVVQTPAPTATVVSVIPTEVPPQQDFYDQVRVSDAGRVVIEVVPLRQSPAEETLHFQVAMNTHVVDLSYDLTQIVELRTDRGDAVSPVMWDAPIGGHHVSGVLYFAPIDLEGVRWIEIVIRGVADVPERVFHWDM